MRTDNFLVVYDFCVVFAWVFLCVFVFYIQFYMIYVFFLNSVLHDGGVHRTFNE